SKPGKNSPQLAGSCANAAKTSLGGRQTLTAAPRRTGAVLRKSRSTASQANMRISLSFYESGIVRELNRTDAGPCRAVQWVFSGGLYTTASQVRQCQVVWPPRHDRDKQRDRRAPGRGRGGVRWGVGSAALSSTGRRWLGRAARRTCSNMRQR